MIAHRVNRRLDALPRTTLVVRGRRLPAFRACGTTGYAVGVVVTTGLAAAHGLSPWAMLALCAVGAITFTVLSAAVRDADGREKLVYYHHQAAVLATTAAALVLTRGPVLAYLDLVAVGLGVFLAFGRVGCLLVGCCHGRPARVGVRYGAMHVRAGFPVHRQGVRLLPVQGLEAAWTLVAVGAGIAAGLGAPGAGLAAYLATYAAGRFVLEYLRGDGARPYLLDLSEAQWTSLALVAGVAAFDPTPAYAVTVAVMVAAIAGTLARSWWRRDRDDVLLTPRHLDELAWTAAHLAGAAAVDGRAGAAAGPVPPAIHVARTSQGLTLSASTLGRVGGAVHHFGLSRAAGLTPETAGELGGVLCVLVGDAPRAALPSRGGDVYHLTVVHRRGPVGR